LLNKIALRYFYDIENKISLVKKVNVSCNNSTNTNVSCI
jgi:hypothetical protein